MKSDLPSNPNGMKYLAKKVYLLIFTLLVGIFFSSCEGPATETVDQEYLHTEKYKQFAEQTTEEQKVAVRQRRSLVAKLDDNTPCPTSLREKLPLQIDKTVVKKKRSTVSQTTKAEYHLEMIACTSVEDMSIRWFLVTKPSIYVNSELLMATYKNGDLMMHEMVGVFRDNLSEDIFTNIDARKGNDGLIISAKTNRDILYPIEQQNTVQTTYRISMEGDIVIEK